MLELCGCFVFLLLGHALCQDPCTSYKLLDEPHRSAAFVPKTTDRLICDRGLVEGWYRFGNNQDMPTSCVQTYHCGTNAPIWLNGALPSINEGEAPRTACVNYGYQSITGTKCCNQQLNIKVKNCNGYYVYHLARVAGCSVAYCAGTQQVCDIGAYNTQTKSCQDLYPKMTQFPELLNPEIDSNNNVRFPCKINYPTGDPSVGFNVMWNVDGQVLVDPANQQPIVITRTGDERVAYLDSKYLSGHLGKNLHCNVTSYFLKTPTLTSDQLNSNPYWCGIKVSKTSITVDEKHPEQEITLESTLPIPCTSLFPQDCKLMVELKASNDPNDVSTSKCVYELVYDQTTKTYKGTVQIKATRDFIDDKDRNHEIVFRPIFNFNQPMWMGYELSPVQIHTVDKESGWCEGTGDPHWTGMDKSHYNTYEVGDFVMYRSTIRDFEVQVRTWACGSYHPCICAIVAREGNDVVQIDMCERRKNELVAPEVKSLSSHPLEETTVDQDKSGKSFFLNFASGARLKIDCLVGSPKAGEKDGYMNVFLQTPSDDKEGTEGLCGTWTGIKTDDFTGPDGHIYTEENSFSHSWSIPTGQSLFDQQPPYKRAIEPHYCRCGGNGDVDCTKGKGANNPNKGCNGPCTNINGKLNPRRNLRHTDSYPEESSNRDRRSTTFVMRNATWPTKSGITKEAATAMCVKGLQEATLFASCGSSNPRIPFDGFLAGCVEDVLYADGDGFLLAHMNTYDNACQDTLLRNISNYHIDSKGELVLNSKSLLGTCPNNCNRQGTCISGSCVCNHGFTSVDCSVPVNVAPIIDHIRGDGICDIRQRPCVKANIIAEHLMSSSALKCRFRNTQSVNGQLVPYGNYIVTDAVFKSFLEVECSLPMPIVGKSKPMDAYSISVTTDGTLWSSEALFVIYDSRCQQCDSHGVCSLKTGTCLIEGVCHRDGEQNAGQLMCKPSVSQISWTKVDGIQEIDAYTASFTGCQCPHKPTYYTCACCQNGGCPCGAIQPNQCTHCEEKVTCGQVPELFPPQN